MILRLSLGTLDISYMTTDMMMMVRLMLMRRMLQLTVEGIIIII